MLELELELVGSEEESAEGALYSPYIQGPLSCTRL